MIGSRWSEPAISGWSRDPHVSCRKACAARSLKRDFVLSPRARAQPSVSDPGICTLRPLAWAQIAPPPDARRKRRHTRAHWPMLYVIEMKSGLRLNVLRHRLASPSLGPPYRVSSTFSRLNPSASAVLTASSMPSRTGTNLRPISETKRDSSPP
jgi:hypothetical protein